MQAESVLAVCAANVCRSPVMAYLLAEESAAAGGVPVPVAFESAGASARGGVALCHTMTSRLARRPGWSAFAEAHRSVRLASGHVESAQLILTATAAERGAVALLVPAARTRTFALREAVALAEHAVQNGVTGVPRELSALAAVLDAQRGRVEPPQPSRWRRSAVVGFDIPDAHTSRVKHERVFRTIEEAVARWSVATAALTA